MDRIIKSAVIIVIFAVVFGLGRWTAPQPEVLEEVVTVTDTTTVDSLRTEVTRWRELAEAEREPVRDTVAVPAPTPIDVDGLERNFYDASYSDSTLSASVGITVDGFVEGVEFEYVLKRERVTTVTDKVVKFRTVETYTTRSVVLPKDRFRHSVEAGYKFNNQFERVSYLEYSPEFRIFGSTYLTGTVHLSKQWNLRTGIKIQF